MATTDSKGVKGGVAAERERWEKTTLRKSLERTPERKAEFTSISGNPIRRLYIPDDLEEGWSYEEKLGFPGEYPYTRGIHATMYRGRIWTYRLFSGQRLRLRRSHVAR